MSMRAALVMITIFGAAGGAAAAGYTYMSGADERARERAEANRVQDIRSGLSRNYERSENPALRAVVAGREVAKDEWSFRASVTENDEKLSPAFGRALLRCASDFDRSECWLLTELTVDGALRLKLSDKEIDRARLKPAPTLNAAPLEEAPEPAKTDDESSDGSSVFGSALGGIASAAQALRAALAGGDAETEAVADQHAGGKDDDGSTTAMTAPVVQEERAPTTGVVAGVASDAGAAGEVDHIANAALTAISKEPTPIDAAAATTNAVAVVDAEQSAERLEEAIVEPAGAQKEAVAPAVARDQAVGAKTESPAEAAVEGGADKSAGQDAVDEGAAAVEAAESEASAPSETEAPRRTMEVEASDAEAGPGAGAATEADTDDVNSDAALEKTETTEAAAHPTTVEATHIVRVSEVNARLEPSMKGRVLAIVTAGQELIELDQRGGWGQYKLMGGRHDGELVWIFGRLVSPAT